MSISLTASACAPGKPLTHFWNVCVGGGRAAEGLRAAWLEQLAFVIQHCGFRYVRFHGLFHDDVFVYRVVNGREIFNFQYIDELFDRLLDLGIKPFVELGFCPGDLATEKNTVFWWQAHGAPPNDYVKWAGLVRRFTQHVIARYGLEEILTWYFEVWNEPNLRPFFRGTKNQYFELYKISAQTLKAIDSRLRVGGPATSNFVPDARFDGEAENISEHRVVTTAKDLDALDWKPVWLEQFLAYCAREDLPVDFISTHPYPTDWALDEHGTGRKLTRGVDATPKDLALLRRMIDSSAFPRAEIHLTEWSSSSSPRDFTHDYLPAATYVVRTNLESIGHVNSLAYWTFTDVFEEGGAGDTAFHGGFGLINFQGIVKPTFHAYRFLAALGDEILVRAAGSIVTRQRRTGKLVALAYHYPPEMPLSVPSSSGDRMTAEATLKLGRPESCAIEFSGLPPHAAFTLELIDQNNANAMSAWHTLGSPEPLSRTHAEHLRAAALATHQEEFFADSTGRLSFHRTLEPWSIMLLRET